ncbi:MAG: ATP-binding cassette domain-containing protein, partial [Sedimenticola sp.]
MLKVDSLSTHYGPIQALFEISLEVHPGELVAMVGANGAGKTTLLQTISGIHKPSGGSISFDGV